MPDSWAPTDCSPSASSRIFPGKNTGVGCHILFQGLLQIQGLNLCLLHCKHIFYHLSYQGSPHVMIKKKKKKNMKPGLDHLVKIQFKFVSNVFTNVTVPSKNCMETIPFTLHLFPLYSPFLVDLSRPTCEVEKKQKQKQQHLLLLRVSFPQNLILRVVRVSERAGAMSRQLSWDRQDTPTCGELEFLASTAAWPQWPCLGSSIRPLMKTALMNCRNYMHSSLEP